MSQTSTKLHYTVEHLNQAHRYPERYCENPECKKRLWPRVNDRGELEQPGNFRNRVGCCNDCSSAVRRTKARAAWQKQEAEKLAGKEKRPIERQPQPVPRPASVLRAAPVPWARPAPTPTPGESSSGIRFARSRRVIINDKLKEIKGLLDEIMLGSHVYRAALLERQADLKAELARL